MTLPHTYAIPNTVMIYDVLDAKDWCARFLQPEAYEFVYAEGETPTDDAYPKAVRYADPSLAGAFARFFME